MSTCRGRGEVGARSGRAEWLRACLLVVAHAEALGAREVHELELRGDVADQVSRIPLRELAVMLHLLDDAPLPVQDQVGGVTRLDHL